jgi:hypothetical protein
MESMTNRIDKPTPPSQEERPRRRLLKILASGGGAAVGIKALPAHWTQPVMENVVLPAHAQTTADGLSLEDPCDITLNIEGEFIVVRVSGEVIGGGNRGGIQINLSAVPTTSGIPDLDPAVEETTTTASNGTYGPFELLFIPNFCPQGSNDGVQVTVTSPDPRLSGQLAICTAGFQKDCPPEM